jgi:hypothetical protein
MAASPVGICPSSVSILKRRPIALTQRRLEANRRNATRSTGPRTPAGKARVARNAIKHGFFLAQQRWTPGQHRDFEETLAGFRDDLQPQDNIEDSCVRTIAESYVRMAALLRYENIAALKHHQDEERELNERIAAADTSQAARLKAHRERLCRAGLWVPTIPGPREAMAIIRYEGKLHRAIRQAASELERRKLQRNVGAICFREMQKRREAPPNSILSVSRRTSNGTQPIAEVQKQTHYPAPPDNGPAPRRRTSSTAISDAPEGPRMASSATHENAKTNPLSSMLWAIVISDGVPKR